MGGIGIGRSIAVVVAALLMMGFIDQTLEGILVQAMATAPVKDEASYVAVRNRPRVLAVTIVTHALAALLTGYVLGKLAGTHEVQHALVTAAFATLMVVIASVTPNVMVPPGWVRIAMAVLTPPALVAGAYVRGQARIIRMEREQS